MGVGKHPARSRWQPTCTFSCDISVPQAGKLPALCRISSRVQLEPSGSRQGDRPNASIPDLARSRTCQRRLPPLCTGRSLSGGDDGGSDRGWGQRSKRVSQCREPHLGSLFTSSSESSSSLGGGGGVTVSCCLARAYMSPPPMAINTPMHEMGESASLRATTPNMITMNLLTLVSTMNVVAVTSCCTRSPAYEMATPLRQESATTPQPAEDISPKT
mmetsp:Transcript_45540/g.96939  ORF Transcript_45540/g.96939 Transcript_45540/m.96939 type:complete len:216 (-) Transcript_45540:760-1407(-)